MEKQTMVKEILQNPIPFLGGFAAGMLRLDIEQEPLKSWLKQQGVSVSSDSDDSDEPPSGPQTISIE
ncbi:hypothetical protein [Synechococcus sp. PCC 7336]|uniref:hypothetical protein n=1 Tax=Synechococcus sp. PCC 7336 TaxID=195250 RepID=UPI000348670E|nr:hypothetical protein [Synechococcus sp. PCC 7336]